MGLDSFLQGGVFIPSSRSQEKLEPVVYPRGGYIVKKEATVTCAGARSGVWFGLGLDTFSLSIFGILVGNFRLEQCLLLE